MQINVTYSTVNQSPYPAGFQAAVAAVAQFFDRLITNNITVNIEVGFGTYDGGQDPGGGAVENDYSFNGNTNSVFVSYATLRSALAAHATSPDDLAALASLPGSDPFGPAQEQNGGYYIQASQARALGIPAGTGNGNIDAYIGFSSSQTYNFNENSRGSGGWDFFGVAFHEFSHALARISNVDSPGFGPAALDLFRYNGLNSRDITNGSPAYFSINSGATDLDGFSTTSDQGDWDSQAGNDANKAFSNLNIVNQFTATDVRLEDVLGFNIQTRPADFNGDGVSDLLWRNTGNGQFTISNLNGNQLAVNAYSNGSMSTPWTLAGTMDFNGDRLADLVWFNNSTGQFTIWDATYGNTGINNATFTNDTFAANSFVGGVSPGWNLVGLGDFNGDGRGDLLWQNGGIFTEWQSTGNGFTPNVYVGGVSSGWGLAGIGDFNGDGRTDLIWQNGGTFTEWQSTGNSFTPNVYVGGVSAGWALAGVGNFTGNGLDDLVWFNSSTDTFTIWDSTGNGFTPNNYIGSVAPGWTLAGIGDYSGFGMDDLLWRNSSTGGFAIWQSTGNGFTPNVLVGNMSSAYNLIGNPTQHIVG
jgi:hypothetical protein